MDYTESLDISNTLITGLPNKLFYNKVSNNILYDRNLSSDAKEFLLKVIDYYRNPEKHGDNWTKKRAMSYFGYSKYKIDKIYKELVRAGYLTVVKVYPHQADPNIEMDEAVHNRICWTYLLNMSPDKEEVKKMISSKNNTEKMKKHLSKTTKKSKTIADKLAQKIKDEETTNKNYYNEALTRYKNSYLYDLTKDTYHIDTDEEVKTEIRNARDNYEIDLESNEDINRVADFCWNLIVKTKTPNDKAFNSYRYSEKGNKMALINTGAIKQAYTKFKTYQSGFSNIPYINNSDDGAIKFLVSSTIIVRNYVNLGFFGELLPEFKDLIGLYKVIAEHPELTGLEYTEESYKILDLFFEKNQENYNKKE